MRLQKRKKGWILFGAMILLGSCGAPEDFVDIHKVETNTDGGAWEDFRSTVYQEQESGIFIVNGDTPVVGEKNLFEFFESLPKDGGLIVHRSGNSDAKWSDAEKLNISYCVSTSFGSNYDTAVSAMAIAAGAWENVANVDFQHKSSQDGNCTGNNNSVVFDIRPVNSGGEYLARAFFPNQSRSSRNVLIDNSAFTGSGDPTVTGVLRHELGHTLGFRHEHTRPEAGTCFEDNKWRALTTYDKSSVMHYPQCNGISSWALNLTSKDAQGAASLYGSPGDDPPPPPPPPGGGDEVTESASGTVSYRETDDYYVDAVGGTEFEAVMTGSGDPDLYVRVGAKPTSSSYDCRPYLDGANESCTLTVPSGQSRIHIMIRGYSSSTSSYNIALTYTPE